MTDIAKEIEKLADKYRNEKLKNQDKVSPRNSNHQNNDFSLDDFLSDDNILDDDFNENNLNQLEKNIDSEIDQEMKVEDFIKPNKNNNIEGAAQDLLTENNQKPKNQALSLMKNISKNLRDLKALIRS